MAVTNFLQGAMQASVEAATGSATNYNSDWEALWDLESIPDNNWNGRMLDWINKKLGVTYLNLPQAQQAFADYNGSYNWASIGGNFDAKPGVTPPGVIGFDITLRAGATNPPDVILRGV